jgi:hypothetical protein
MLWSDKAKDVPTVALSPRPGKKSATINPNPHVQAPKIMDSTPLGSWFLRLRKRKGLHRAGKIYL